MAADYRDMGFEYYKSGRFLDVIDKLVYSNKLQQARDLAERVLQFSPENPEVMLRLGIIFYEMDNFTKATSTFMHAREMGNSDEEIDYYLGEISYINKEYAVARRHYDEYLQKLTAPGCTTDLAREELERIACIAAKLYTARDSIGCLKYIRFLLKNAILWTDWREYFAAAVCLHEFDANMDEKYSHLDSAIAFSDGKINYVRERYADMLYDDAASGLYPQRQKDLADRAINMYESVGINNMRRIDSLGRLKHLYKYFREWDTETGKKMRMCTLREELLRSIKRIKNSKRRRKKNRRKE